MGLVDDGSPLRPVLHMLTPSRDFGQILVDQVDPALRGPFQFSLPPPEVGTSAPASVADCLAFSLVGRTTVSAFAVAVLLRVVLLFFQEIHTSPLP